MKYLLVILLVVLCGCSSSIVTENYDRIPPKSSFEERQTKEAKPPFAEPSTNLSKADKPIAIKQEVASDSKAKVITYTGEGKSYSRMVKSTRIFSPFGVSPGEVAAKQEPAKITEGPSAGFSLNEEGVNVKAEKKADTLQTGGSQFTWYDSLREKWNSWLWRFVFIGIVCLVLWIIPLTRPIIVGIASLLGQFIKWLWGKVSELWKKDTDITT